MAGGSNCENCSHYIYDDYFGYYVCDIDLDIDEMERFLSGSNFDCNYFDLYDEYKIVRKQN